MVRSVSEFFISVKLETVIKEILKVYLHKIALICGRF